MIRIKLIPKEAKLFKNDAFLEMSTNIVMDIFRGLFATRVCKR